MKSTLFLILLFLALTTARIPTEQQKEFDSVTAIQVASPAILQKPKSSTDPERIQLDLCDCQPATGEPGGLSCDKEGFFIASFERQGQWVAGGGAVPLSRAICCRPCLPTDLPDDIFDLKDDRPLALVSLGCHASTDPLGIRCEADANSYISGFTSAIHVFSAVDTQYPVDTAQCCTPALLMESGDAWELERCECGVSTDPEHSVSCSIASGGGSDEKNSSTSSSSDGDIPAGSILSGFDFFRISPLGQVVPIGPAKCCGVCLTGKIHPAADCQDLNHCSGKGVCLLGRCECLQGWGSPDCSQSLAGKGGWGGKIPAWAISLIVIGSCLLGMLVVSAVAHVVELIYDVRSRRDGSNDGDDDDSRRPLLLRIDADDAGSVGSQDTEGAECDDDQVLLGGVEERIERVIHRLEERDAAAGTATMNTTNREEDENEEEVISDGEGGTSVQEEEQQEQREEDAAGSSAPSSRGGTLGTLLSNRTTTEIASTTTPEVPVVGGGEGDNSHEEGETPQEDNGLEKPAAGGGGSSALQSYMGIGPLSGVDCVVCMIRPVQTVIIPCGHVCMCRRCSRRLNRCPVCRKDVVRRQRLFV